MSPKTMSNSQPMSYKEAAKIASVVVATYILVPTLLAFANDRPNLGGFFALQLVTGLSAFPVLLVLFKLFLKNKKNEPQPALGSGEGQSVGIQKISKWSYFGIVAGPLALIFFFGPPLMAGETDRSFFIGTLFWVVVIFFSLKNILQKVKK
jgi:hypothetical protein